MSSVRRATLGPVLHERAATTHRPERPRGKIKHLPRPERQGCPIRLLSCKNRRNPRAISPAPSGARAGRSCYISDGNPRRFRLGVSLGAVARPSRSCPENGYLSVESGAKETVLGILARRTTALPAGRGFDPPSAFDSIVRRVPPTPRRDTKHGECRDGGGAFFRPRPPGQERDALATFQMETQGDFAFECPSGA
jgi:hypothetical protein